MTALEKWKNDFKEFISELSIPRDDYKGIMEYIDEVPNEALEQKPCEDVVKKDCGNCAYYDNGANDEACNGCFEDEEHLNFKPKAQPCEDCISREEAINCVTSNEFRYKIVEDIKTLPPPVTPLPKRHEKLTNHEWIDFLSEQFDISRTSAKEMLHAMMSVKKEDNFKKQFSQGFSQDRKRGE